jgi:broad specificity phosphatase PhoE
MTAPRRLVFWRHGRTEWNAQMRFQGQTDIALDEVGLAQAERAAAMLASLQPSIIISSDLTRAHQTASALARIVDVNVDTDQRLRETFAGDWEGLTRDVLESRYGAELAAWSAFSDVRPGGHGETRIEVADRMEAAVVDALAQLQAGQTMVVATHGGAARTAIGRLLRLPHETWGALGVLTNCSWSVLVENLSGQGSPWRLQEYNAGTLPEPALGDDR